SRRSLWQMEQGFNSTLPLANDELGISANLNTSPAASSFPFVSSDLTSDNGILYGVNRHNNSLILFDRFSLPNANSVVFATSGAGKSYAVKLEVLRSMMMGSDVIIIDPEREYEHLSEAVGGSYINISLNSESKINPFDLPRAIGGQERAADIIRSAVITLKGLVRLMLGQFTNEEDSIIDRALLETYAKKDITASSDLSAIEPPIMRDFQEVLQGMEGGAPLSERLAKYTSGTFAGLLNEPTNVDMSNQLVVFSVRDLEDELRPMAVYAIVNYIWNIVRSSLKKRILVIDEAWWLMQHEDSAKFIFALVKRARKYYLGVTTITQDVNDFLASQYGQAIVTNSALQLLLRQSPASIDNVVKTFMLTEGEKYLLLEGSVGEGIFFAGNKHAAIKVVASYTEDQIITSDPRQLLEIERAKKEFAQEKGASKK
ncbi:ATP-binding protein, partial [Patescibacteria group bacterium]|nr:ATP-binding protein [Patescibacteria group bacterium]